MASALLGMIPGIVGGIGSIGSLISSLFGNNQNTVTPVGSAADMTNVNPYTAGQMSGLQNLMNQFRSSAAGNLANYGADRGNLANMINQVSSQTPYNPQASMNAFFNNTPQLQSLVQGLTSPFGQSAQQAAQLQSSQAIKQAMGALAGQGGIRSGAALNQAVNAAALPRLQALTQMQQLQSQLGGQLGGQLMGELGTQYQTQGQLQQQQNQALLNSLMGQLQQSGNMYGTDVGALTNFSGQANSLANPQWYDQAYMVGNGNNTPQLFGAALGQATGQGSGLMQLLQQLFNAGGVLNPTAPSATSFQQPSGLGLSSSSGYGGY